MKVLSISTPKRYSFDTDLWESVDVVVAKPVCRLFRKAHYHTQTVVLKRKVVLSTFDNRVIFYGSWWKLDGNFVGYTLDRAIEEYRHQQAMGKL